MTDEEYVLVSTGRWGEVYHQPLGTTTFPRCGRNAQQDVDFDRVPRAEAEAEYDQCQRCPFDTPAEGDDALVADGGFSARTEPGQFDVDELDLVDSPEAALIGARLSGVADYRGQPHATRIKNDEIVQIRTDSEGRRVFLTRPVCDDGVLGTPVRKIPIHVFDCDRVAKPGGGQGD